MEEVLAARKALYEWKKEHIGYEEAIIQIEALGIIYNQI